MRCSLIAALLCLFWQPAPVHPQPLIAPVEVVTGKYIAEVDFIVVNRYRKSCIEFDENGRETTSYSEQWYISFYDWKHRTVPLLGGSIPTGLIHYGFRHFPRGTVSDVSACSDGRWSVLLTDGLVIVGSHLYFIDSTYDWEVSQRKDYRPINVP